MEAISMLRNSLAQADVTARRQLLDALRDLQLATEAPYETLQRFAGLHLEIAAARIGEDLKLFQILEGSKEPLNIYQLADKTDAAPLLLGRILRYLASVGQVNETDKDTFAASEITRTLAQVGYRGGVYHFFDNIGPVMQDFPDFLAQNKYQDITDASKTVFQKTFKTNLPGFAWLPTQPKRFGPLQEVMAVQAQGGVPWFTVFPFTREIEGFIGPHILVDVGGGFGHQCIGLQAIFPELAGKLILQDLPQTIAVLPPIAGVEIMAHNFFEPQPIQGARFYYLRNILHDWPDNSALGILTQLKASMGPESQILIDDMVLPDHGVHWQAAQIDLTMMASLGSRERTESEWKSLLDAAGFHLVSTTTYQPRRQDSILQCVPR